MSEQYKQDKILELVGAGHSTIAEIAAECDVRWGVPGVIDYLVASGRLVRGGNSVWLPDKLPLTFK